ncbi:MAG TPA: Spo0E family sporulation regulatory protein-aspartic acid phosphatase [Firmicutes bacterium]|jgi:hypothetical protein|nr:Spo0E family sporulation regulatory protein-aspartic acid phosphatase [Bacillota bacterium]
MSISEDYVSLEILQERIKTARDRMHQLWSEKGYTDTDVLNASIELDDLLNEYQRRFRFLKG